MSDVKRYYVGVNTKCLGGIGLVEMTDLYREATGFDGLVMGKDYDALKAENESLRKDAKYWSEAHDRELAWSAQLIEEREELRKDAERYRLMREMTLAQTDDAPDEFDSAFDSQLDAALGQGEQS